MTDILDDLFHSVALQAFLEVAHQQQGWPDSKAVQRRSYQLYEEELKEKNATGQSFRTQPKEGE